MPLPGGRIRYRAPGPLPEGVEPLLDELREHKLEALTLLAAERFTPWKLAAVEYDTRTRVTTKFYSDGTTEVAE